MVVRGISKHLINFNEDYRNGGEPTINCPNKPKRNELNACSVIFHICSDAEILQIFEDLDGKPAIFYSESTFASVVIVVISIMNYKIGGLIFRFFTIYKQTLEFAAFSSKCDCIFFYNGYSLFTVCCTDKDIVVKLRTIY